jgi:protein ImuA
MRREPARSLRGEEVFAAVTALRQRENVAPLIAALRRHIARIEQSAGQFETATGRGLAWMCGLPEIDRHLPAQGLLRNGLHDVSPAAYGDQPAAMGFALALALRRLADPQERRPLLWCRLATQEREHGRLYGHGLERLGLARQRFVTLTLNKPQSLLWTMEEALKSGALAIVIGDAGAAHADLTVTRRLALAAAAGKTAGLLVFARDDVAASASQTRWRAASMASLSPSCDAAAPGGPCWLIELIKARGGRPGQWLLEWHHAHHRFSLVPGFRGGAVHPWADQAAALRPAQKPALRAG